MAATTLTRTIPLSGGRQDDVDEFSQDTPTMAEATNVRFRKVGEVEKCLPYIENTNTVSASPAALATVGDKLFGVDTNGQVLVHKEGSADWTSVPSAVIPSRNTVVQALTPANGGANYTFVEDDDYRMVAYERRKPQEGATAFQTPYTDLIIEVYDIDNGVLVDRATLSNCYNPQCIDPGNGVACYYVAASGSISYYTAPSGVLTHNATGITTCELDFPNWAVAAGTNRDLLRIGQSESGSYSGLFVVGSDPNGGAGGAGRAAIMWRDTVGNTLETQSLYESGALWGSAVTISGTDTGQFPMDIHVNGIGAAYIFGRHSETAGTWNTVVKAATGTINRTPTWNAVQTVHNTTGTAVNGSIYLEDISGLAYYGFTSIGRDMDEHLVDGADEDTRVEFGTVNASAVNAFGTLYHHRLSSKVVKTAGIEAVTAVVEQYSTLEPYNSDTDGLVSVPTFLKGVTPILLDMHDGGNYNIRTAFDVGQSRNCIMSGAEQQIHLPNLYRSATGFDLKFINRVQLQPEDLSVQARGTDPTYKRRVAVLHPGEAKGIIYEVTNHSTTDPMVGERVGENTVLNSSIPLSFDGNALGELSPLDQPEIVVYKLYGGALANHVGYEQLGGTPDNYRTVQAVVGYADANGQLHRSAPSFPLFVESNVDAANDGTNIWRRVAVTVPLTCSSNRDYFIEVYVGQGSNEPQLAGVHVTPLQTHSWVHGRTVIMDSLTQGNLDPVRYSETIYSAGNVLVSDPWPNFDDFIVTSNRLFAVGSTNSGTIYYSKLFEENISPEFSASLTIPMGRGRTLKAIGKIDDKVIAFTADEIFAIYDTGPDNTGANGTFIVDKLQSAFGCEDANSLIEIADGLAFYSKRTREFHLITRDLQVADIGKPIQDASDALTPLSVPEFKQAIVIPDQHEIRWHAAWTPTSEFGEDPKTGTGIPTRPARPRYQRSAADNLGALVYNYHYKRWSIHNPFYEGVLFTTKDGRAHSLTGAWRHYEEVADTWIDAPLMMVETPWIRIANLQSFGRIDELTLLGKYLSKWNSIDNDLAGNTDYIEAGDVQVDLWYDYEDSPTPADTYRFRANRGDLGDGSSYGDRMQLAVHPGQPKCQALKMRVTEIATEGVEVSEPNYSPGRGFSLTGLDIIYTPKAGTGSKTLSPQRRK